MAEFDTKNLQNPNLSAAANRPIANAVTPCSNCCCCVKSLRIENIKNIGSASVASPLGGSLSNGHSFDVVIELNYSPGNCGNTTCELVWKERSNLTHYRDQIPDVWYTVGDEILHPEETLEGTTLSQWHRMRRSPPCPKGGTQRVKITDRPTLGNDPLKPNEQRKLEFEITVQSGSGCKCNNASMTVRATQILQTVNNQLVVSTFKIEHPR